VYQKPPFLVNIEQHENHKNTFSVDSPFRNLIEIREIIGEMKCEDGKMDRQTFQIINVSQYLRVCTYVHNM
jgi:hypothetical protein